MCGIVGYIGKKQAAPILLDGLEKLEYRGYDSAGMAVYDGAQINIKKATGRLKVLNELTHGGELLPGTVGIGHTRWATHGEPSDVNAHPHFNADHTIAVVHNGIIENYLKLRNQLIEKGYSFISETDTEVVAHLLDYYYKKCENPLEAVTKIMHRVEGSYALGILFADEPDVVYAVRKDSPLIVGKGKEGNLIASDVPAVLKYTREVYFIENEEIARLSEKNIEFFNVDGEIIQKESKTIEWDINAAEKGGYEHFMLKEINEEPELVKKLLNLYTENNKVKDIFDIKKYKNIDIVACGSASFAGQLGKYYIEKFANIRVNVYFASEYRYQTNFFDKDTLVILISQSGETADTLASLKLAKENNIDTLAIVNRHESSIAREAKYVIYTEAGIEVAVATTKAYLAQVLVLLFLAIKGSSIEEETINSLKPLPNIFTKYINEYNYEEISKIMVNKTNIFYLGRLVDYYLAMEGSLKLKEISYIHSEAFQAGELKHGSISLIDKDFGVIAVVTDKEISEKTISNLKEVESRGANIVTITNIKDDDFSKYKILLDDYNEVLNPLMAIIPMQLLAYNIAKLKGCDIDKPRNLAKSVTVE